MNLRRYYLTIALLFQFLLLNAQTNWQITDPQNLDFNIKIVIVGNKITGMTREGALKDYVGKLNYNLAKMGTSLKYPEIVHFEGEFDHDNPKTFKGTYNNLFSQYNFLGSISGDSLSVILLDQQGKPTKHIKGVRIGNVLHEDYNAIVSKIINLTEENLFDPSFLKSTQWKDFKSRLIACSKNMADLLELQTGFYAIARNFPFSHYNLVTNRKSTGTSNFLLKEVDKATCILKIKSFEGNRITIDTLLDQVHANRYSNLIIDLRGNSGGSNETALPIISYLSKVAVTGGIFPNKNWYQQHKEAPGIGDYKEFAEFNSGALDDFYSMAAQGNGLFIRSLPGTKHFQGKVYVLCNGNTASTSEVLIQGLKENKLAEIVGKKTAGAALSGRRFNINKELSLFIPVNGYTSYTGYKIDKNGIKPDVEIDGDALAYVLKKLKQ